MTELYPTKVAARKALGPNYLPSFAKPGLPIPWTNKLDLRDVRAIYGSDLAGWRIIPYPRLNWLDN